MMAAGECVASLAITEPDAGSDMQVELIILICIHLFVCSCFFSNLPDIGVIFIIIQGARTTAKRDGDDWIINGSKIYITNG